MPSFDLVSEIDKGELKNAVDQAQREIATRYDFKGSDCRLELKNNDELEIEAANEYQVQAGIDILRSKMIKRGIGVKSLSVGDIKPTGSMRYKVNGNFVNGIDKDLGKKINKFIKESGIKVTSAYLDEKIRITGKKIDDLQEIYKQLRSNDDIGVDLQMQNMKS